MLPPIQSEHLVSPEKGEATIDVLGGLPHQKKNTNIDSQWFLDVKTLCFFGGAST